MTTVERPDQVALARARLAAATHRVDEARARLGELSTRAGEVGGTLASRAGEVGGTVASRAGEVGGTLAARAGEVRHEVTTRAADLEQDLQPVVRRARRQGWQAFRTLIGALLVIPRAVVRGLAVTSDAVDRLLTRVADLTARTREVAATVAPTPRDRRRRRLRTAGLVGLGFGAGVATGWAIAARRPRPVTATSVEQHVEDVAPPPETAVTATPMAGEVAAERATPPASNGSSNRSDPGPTP